MPQKTTYASHLVKKLINNSDFYRTNHYLALQLFVFVYSVKWMITARLPHLTLLGHARSTLLDLTFDDAPNTKLGVILSPPPIRLQNIPSNALFNLLARLRQQKDSPLNR